VWVEPTGRRAAAPMLKEADVTMDMGAVTPIPYFPGRETLWFPASDMSVAKAEVDENDMLHPLATGAEAYYRYTVGDSVSFQLPDGRRIALRELRIRARTPQWRAFVGSFWFDVDRGSLVRAAYRMAAEMDIWQMIGEDERQEIEEELEQAGKKVSERRGRAEDDDGIPMLVKGLMHPMRANISAITVEYGLHEGQFWLPKVNVAEGMVQTGFLRMPVKIEERFDYARVNGDVAVPRVPTPAELGFEMADSTLSSYVMIGDSPGPKDSTAAARRRWEDSVTQRQRTLADSLRREAESARTRGDSATAARLIARANAGLARARRIEVRRDACAHDSTHVAGVGTRMSGAVRIAIRMPCDTARLSRSPDLTGSIYEAGEELFGTAERDALLESLDLDLQPVWGPQPPQFRTGLAFLRFNRIEGFSLGGEATSELGLGYRAAATARIGTGDWVPNAELAIARSNGRRELRLGVFHRLGVANDDWGSPLSLGASVANLLHSRDEGFYYRTFGAELGGSREAPAVFGGAPMAWRLFVERQRSAGEAPNTQISLANGIGRAAFGANIDAASLTAVGAGAELSRTFGVNPLGFRLLTRARGEAAMTSRASAARRAMPYGRLAVDGTASRGFGRVALALTGAAGSSVGDLPIQRAFFVGGLQTVRGQFARPDSLLGGHVGDAFWLTRTELGMGLVSARPVVFYDVGWAGPRARFAQAPRPLSGAGVGASFLDGLARIDLSRGIAPERRWRLDFHLGSRF